MLLAYGAAGWQPAVYSAQDAILCYVRGGTYLPHLSSRFQSIVCLAPGFTSTFRTVSRPW